jgi:hypothetical protein
MATVDAAAHTERVEHSHEVHQRAQQQDIGENLLACACGYFYISSPLIAASLHWYRKCRPAFEVAHALRKYV